jgi:hypothetical protein
MNKFLLYLVFELRIPYLIKIEKWCAQGDLIRNFIKLNERNFFYLSFSNEK